MSIINNNLKTVKNLSLINSNDDFNDNKCINEEIIMGQFIRDCSKSKKIKLKKLCENICSLSYFSEFLHNDKSMNKLELDLILQRLGVSENNFEHYIPLKDYEIFMIRHKIIDLINIKEIYRAEKEIELYEKKITKSNKLHQRFILIMKAKILQEKNEDYEKIYLTLREAVWKTVPLFENGSIEELILSHNELFFMIECVKFREKAYNDGKSQSFYNDVITYIEVSDLDYIIKAQLYTKAVCLKAENMLKDNKFDLVLNNCDKAIEYLQKSLKLYFVEKIMYYKGLALEGLIELYKDKIEISLEAIEKYNIYNNSYIENEEQREIISEIFKEHNLSSEINDWYPQNNVRELYSIGEIIKKRRGMLEQSQFEFSEGICDVTTLSRIESGKTAPWPRNANNLLKRARLFGEFQAFTFECKSYEAYKLENEMSDLIVLMKYNEAYEILQKFKEKIDTSSKLNKQYLGHSETAILNGLGIMTDKEAIDKYIEALELTVNIKKIFSNEEKYFSKREIMLIYNIAAVYKRLCDYKNSIQWLELLVNYYNNLDYDLSNYIITYELVMFLYSSLLGDIKNYDKSDEVAVKSLYESLKCGRGGFIGSYIYSTAWNMKDKIEQSKRKMQPYELALYKDKLKKALMISRIMGDYVIQDFIKTKLNEVNYY